MKHAELIGKMTLEEKCAFLSGADVWHTRAVEHLSIPAIALSDGPSGLRKQAGDGDHLGLNASTKATCMPSSSAVACSWNEEVAHSVGSVIGREAAAQDVQVLLGPGLNTKRSPLCGRNFEYYSEDPYLSGKMAAAFIRGVQENGVSACAKHFAANSQEMLRMSSNSVMDERTLREMYLTNFEIAVKEGKPKAIMTSYNQLNSVYTNENTHLLQEILRDDWHFDGAVITDWGGDNDYTEGVRAGCNLEMPGSGDDSALQLIAAVREGKIEESAVNQRVDELLTLVMETSEARASREMDFEYHHFLAEKAAEESIVLLKNEGNILPLAQCSKIAVIGDFADHPRFQGAGSSMVNAAKEEKLLDLLPEHFKNVVGYAQGFQRLNAEDEKLASQAEELAKKAEIVIMYIGLTEGYETEGLDRAHLHIPDNQVALLKRIHQVNPHIVAVVTAGSAIEMPWIDQCEAMVWTGLAGQAAAAAVLRVLSGEINPSGKLTETFPLHYEKTPISQYYPGKEKSSEYREGIYVGYRFYQTAEQPVLFPFGFGLSYTAFRYANLQVTDSKAEFDLTNAGKYAGAEVAQLYVSLPNAKIFRPKMELKGFAKVSLKPGETKHVTISLDDKAFRYFNEKTNHWEVEGGDYQVHIAASAEDIRLTGTLHVQGTNAPDPYAGKELPSYRSGKIANVSDAEFEQLLGHKPPQKMWDRKAPLGMNDTVRQMVYAKNPICRAVARYLGKQVDKSVVNGKPDLNMLFIYNIPFRGMAKMMNGMVSMKMARSIMTIANGHFFKGVGGLIHGFFHRPKLK